MKAILIDVCSDIALAHSREILHDLANNMASTFASLSCYEKEYLRIKEESKMMYHPNFDGDRRTREERIADMKREESQKKARASFAKNRRKRKSRKKNKRKK